MIYFTIEKIKAALKQDPFVTTVTEGDIFDVDLNKKTLFPLSHIIVNNALHQGNVWEFSISILCMDVVDEGELTDNKIDIWNTQFLVANRLLDRLNRGDLAYDNFQLVGNPTLDPFTERFENSLAGWSVDFSIQVRNDMTICNDVIKTFDKTFDKTFK